MISNRSESNSFALFVSMAFAVMLFLSGGVQQAFAQSGPATDDPGYASGVVPEAMSKPVSGNADVIGEQPYGPLAGEAGSLQAVRAISKQEYLGYIIEAAEEGWASIDEARKNYADGIDLNYVFGYNPPPNDLYLAGLSANAYKITKDTKYLDRAKDLLLYYGKYKEYYPADFHLTKAEYGDVLPTIPNIFPFSKYVQAFEILDQNNRLNASERKILSDAMAESADYIVRFQEWGPMNRAMLRAEALTYVAKVLPDHPRQKIWKMAGEAIADDNWGKWEIEDATGYHGVWLYSLLGYASHVREDESLYRTPVLQYYFEYFLKLMSPAGIIPDFGDAYWGAGYERFIPFFEKAATVNKDPRLRWAAASHFRKYLEPLPERKGMFTALCLSDAYLWADFDLPATAPTAGSEEVLDPGFARK